jgi:AbrB family looped-hinge helix DNA binding protein
MAATATVRVDTKGRLTIPAAIRQELGIEPGDTFFLRSHEGVLHYARAENPFDALADLADAEFEAGQTISLHALAAELGVKLDDD